MSLFASLPSGLSNMAQVANSGLGGGIKFDDILKSAGGLATAFGQGRGTAPTSTQLGGFTTLPKEQKDFMTKQIFDMIKQYQARPYEETTVPMRGLNMDDYDPIFGSKARVAMGNYYNQKAAANQEQQPQKQQVNQPIVDASYGMNRVQQMLANSPTKSYMNPWVGFQQRATDTDYADLSKALQAGNDFTSNDVLNILNRGRIG